MIDGREIALAALAMLDTPPPEVVDVAAAAGFDAITLRLADGSDDENPLVGDTPVRRETLARLRHHGLGVLDVEVIRLNGDTDVAGLRPVFESAAALGALNVLVIGNEPDEDRLVERFRELCEEAAPLGLGVALEFMVFTSCRTLEDASRIVERAEHPAAVVLVDPLHLRRSGGSPADVARLVAEHPERFPYAQLCDAPLAAPGDSRRDLYREAVDHRLNAGDGELPLAALVAALPAGVPLSVETPVHALKDRPAAERARRAMEATRRLFLAA
jgi:sugar phosphate isomerase/epimerase